MHLDHQAALLSVQAAALPAYTSAAVGNKALRNLGLPDSTFAELLGHTWVLLGRFVEVHCSRQAWVVAAYPKVIDHAVYSLVADHAYSLVADHAAYSLVVDHAAYLLHIVDKAKELVAAAHHKKPNA